MPFLNSVVSWFSAPVAVIIGRNLGIDEFRLGVLMVMVTQIGSTTPPVDARPLLAAQRPAANSKARSGVSANAPGRNMSPM